MEFKSVVHLNQYLKQLFEADDNLRNVIFSGEISNLKYHQSGHIYLTLKDEDSRINAVMFSSNARRLRIKLVDGMKVRAAGSVGVYDRGGTYQVYLSDLQQEGTGSLYLQFETLKKKLFEEGLFSKDFKKPLPSFPSRIGVISAPSGAAIRDIITTLRRRWPLAEIILLPSLMQGKEATEDIVQALRQSDTMGFDVILLSRGGGSIEDLWCFNEEAVARAIFAMRTPIISAIGHEIDVTIADYVSDLRAPTPTGAAEIATPNYLEVIQQFSQYRIRIETGFANILKRARTEHKRLFDSPYLRQPEMLYATKRMTVDGAHQRLVNIKQRMFHYTDMKLVNYNGRIQNIYSNLLQLRRHNLNLISSKLASLNPNQVLKRGYALVERDGIVIDSSKLIEVNDALDISWFDGKVRTKVTHKEESNHDK